MRPSRVSNDALSACTASMCSRCVAFWSVLYTFYIVNGLAKSGNTWRLGGTLDAVSLSFRYSPLATGLGYALSGVPWLCRAATLITVPLELAGPVLHGAQQLQNTLI